MDNQEKIKNLRIQFDNEIEDVNDLKILNDIRVNYLGKKSPIQELSRLMGGLSEDEKKSFGASLNDLKNYVTEKLDDLRDGLEAEGIRQKLETEKIDVTLPGTKINAGAHMLEKMIEEMEQLFISMGYDIVEGPEVEKDLYNFEMLNLPKGHPARDAQDSFYVEGDEMLLRSQTSPVQVRTMLANTEKGPIRIFCPGKTYRRDNDDATHSHQFTQIEALIIDKNISLADLKGTCDVIAKHFFGKERVSRFRPSFYQFTEPSVEFDISCFNCGGKGCNICKRTGWITIGGAGVVHPNVLRMSGYDPELYTGFAFGFGAERMAMLKYGITDVRTFYTNDLRSITQFDKREGE